MNFFYFYRMLFLFTLSCSLMACQGTGRGGLRYPSTNATDGQVCADLVRMPQDLRPYAQNAGADRILLSAEEQAKHEQRMRQLFFMPWQMREPNKALKRSLEDNFNLRPERAYAENLRPFSLNEWQRLRDNANVRAYPSRAERAITVRNTALRAMPTGKPFFLDPDTAGEGYPFDYFQQTAVWLGTPVFISHVSADGAWVLAETRLSAGWMPAADVAVVDAALITRWQSLPLMALARDNIVLAASSGRADQVTGKRLGTRGHIGTLLPLAGKGNISRITGTRGNGFDGEEALSVFYPKRSVSGHAEIATAALEPGEAVRVPLPLTPAAIARIGNEMMGQPYGWGGLLENRDCSAMTRDLFTPFGIWLPRNSTNQGSWGRPVVLTGLSPDEKEARILSEAVPFFSLIWLRGHIGLYVGEFVGKPAMFHNVWGVRTLSQSGDSGRAVIGKAVVTSLRPGTELSNLASSNGIIDRIERVSILPEVDDKLPVSKVKPTKRGKVMRP